MYNYDFLSFFIAVLIGSLTAYLAKGRGRSPALWFCIGVLFGAFGVLALFLFKPQVATDEKSKEITVVGSEAKPINLEPSSQPTLEKAVTDLRWFYLDSQHQQYGPVTFAELELLWKEGKIGLSTYVWSEGMAEWNVIKDLPLLLSQLPQQEKMKP